MSILATLLAQTEGVPAFSWQAQLGIATPVVSALIFMGRWVLVRLDRAEAERSALFDKVLEDVMPAIRAGTVAIEKTIEQQQKLEEISAHHVASLEHTIQLQGELLKKQEELRQEELRIARRRGGN